MFKLGKTINNFNNKLLFNQIRKYNHYNGLKGSQIVHQKLLENKVKDVFVYTGGAIMPIIDELYNSKIKYYINTHEQYAGHAATAYARSSNNTGVVLCTSGPGLTNTITPMLDATNDSTPLVVISGQVSMDAMGTDAFQEAPSTEITKSITKWNYCVKDINELPTIIDNAFKIANDGKKGAVHIDIPKCISSKILKNKKINNIIKSNLELQFEKKFEINKEYPEKYMKKIINFINNSKKPVLYVGQGCNNSSEKLRKFAIKSNIPVTTTIHAMGAFDEKNKLSLQFLGMHGNPVANYSIQNSDCIIALGSRFDDRTTGNLKKYAPYAVNAGGIIHCDINKNQIDKVVNTNFGVNMDCDKFLDILLKDIKFNKRTEWNNKINEWKKKYYFKYPKYSDNTINAQMVIKEIDNQTNDKENYFFTTGVGNHQMYAAQFINWSIPKRFITSGSLGVMGFGLPAAIGVQIANPNKKVIDIDGDGSFNMSLSDLKTIKRYNLPIKIALMNNSNLGMVDVWCDLFYNKRSIATKNPNNPDYTKLANSFGIKSIYCDNSLDLKNKIEEFINFDGPILAEFKVKQEMCLPLVKPGSSLDDMVLDNNDIDIKSNIAPN